MRWLLLLLWLWLLLTALCTDLAIYLWVPQLATQHDFWQKAEFSAIGYSLSQGSNLVRFSTSWYIAGSRVRVFCADPFWYDLPRLFKRCSLWVVLQSLYSVKNYIGAHHQPSGGAHALPSPSGRVCASRSIFTWDGDSNHSVASAVEVTLND